MSAVHLPVLAAEDEETDALILQLAFKKARVPNPLIVVGDGEQAVDYLAGSPPYSDRVAHPLPVLLILDLKMPRISGFDVLSWLTNHPEFKDLPSIVFSSSPAESDIQKARQMGARDYIVKPHGLGEMVKAVEQIRDRWLVGIA